MPLPRFAPFVLGLSLAASTPVAAHHYFAAAFDATNTVHLKGVLTRIQWSNPHTHLFLDVKGDTGRVLSWSCETSPPNVLSRIGLNRDNIKVGDAIVVDGYRAKSGSLSLLMLRLTLPNGRVISTPSAGNVPSP